LCFARNFLPLITLIPQIFTDPEINSHGPQPPSAALVGSIQKPLASRPRLRKVCAIIRAFWERSEMERAHLDEWCSLQDEAFRKLAEPKEHKEYVSRLFALVLPSCEDSCRYELLTPARRSSATRGLAAKTVWRFSEDNPKLVNPLERLRWGPGVRLHPTIHEYQNEIDASIVEDLCRRASQLQVTPVVPRPLACRRHHWAGRH
jgi:hypothetical protein